MLVYRHLWIFMLVFQHLYGAVGLYGPRMAESIDHEGAEPVYRQLAAILAARIESGELRPNRPIPSESRLCQEFGVARGTARKAIAKLRDEKLVVTIRGRGTYVEPDP